MLNINLHHLLLFRLVYDKLILALYDPIVYSVSSRQNLDIDSKFDEKYVEKIASAYYSMNRFLSAFIDHVSLQSVQ